MNTSRLMIVMSDKSWTLAALHLVCALSRHEKMEVLLLKMMPVRHPSLLGTEAGYLNLHAEDAQVLDEMVATAEDYGVSLDVELFQYADYWSGIVDAANQLGATAVIARIPPSPIPYWQILQRWWFRRHLARQQQVYLPLDGLKPSLVWTPSVTLQNEMAQLLTQR